jgi:hypothetical protein
LLHLGADISYVLYENPHIETITWIDEDMSKTGIDSMIFKPEYSLIVCNQHMIRAGLLRILEDKLTTTSIMAVMQTRYYDSQRIIDRSISMIDELKIVSRLEICDRDNHNGWGNGVILYDIRKSS